jgi:hypothetical protein
MNEAAISVTAKMHSRRFVPPVMRTPPLLRLTLCDVLPVGNRGTKARSTTIARAALETAIHDGVTEDEAEPVALKESDFWMLTA